MKHPAFSGGFFVSFSLGKRMKKKNDKPSTPCNHKENRFVVIIPYGHSAASMLLANGYSLKEIQEWLGHGTLATTANTYAHLQFQAKQDMAVSLGEKLVIG